METVYFARLTIIQIVNFKGWDGREEWLAHVRAITSLLEIRGKKQFERELGAQLYIHARNCVVSLTDIRCVTICF